jgi:uncharacterized protein (DUF1778 family)
VVDLDSVVDGVQRTGKGVTMSTTVISSKVDRAKERPLIRLAAESEGLTVSQFIRETVVEAARQRVAALTQAPADR